ncbi:4-(cytidine 5'-diphospho)-2-C-methyl-D-erythritol kinase [Parachitinimonas caeni]|uniref:4-diphosphocytidyl-2-C-methyl-D-erythritol kinase n=1 Tax=Parachitinimonas caeni TaxID=3031301 RepID=A0ABT7E1Z8_9NEIS|nr:4-(cytidine 5'-diphospho)-2-C-methyl-D-erythritol kinase [Parachitinimonas caeni]MDK2126334.1 4-(cytidine 5'-diphospho)-2-C-methyl-D-erythritol kinase [Parachitinimonas caeni]
MTYHSPEQRPGFLALPAPAKLNLFLHVNGRRPDGYHLLQTLFRFIDYGDTVYLRVREDGAINRVDPIPGVPAESDLTVRAAKLLQDHTGSRLGVDIGLEKRLPMGGGLGGGSSDAATVLIGLNTLWQLGLSRRELQSLGLKLGADVPVFIFGRNAFAEGIGESLQAVELPDRYYLVLVPPVSISTAEIFCDEGLTRDTPLINMAVFPMTTMRNDLQSVACRKYPVVRKYIDLLSGKSKAMMTGSGACVFAEFESLEAVQEAKKVLCADIDGFSAFGLNQHPLLSWPV